MRRLIFVLSLLTAHACAETITLPASADTTLFETYPTNNLGAVLSTAAGTTVRGKRSRGLYRFDVAGRLPANADITAATLRLTVVRIPNSGQGISSTFGLHRVLRAWTEGNKSIEANGSVATSGEPTWLARQHPAGLWSAPGAAAPADFMEEPTAEQFIEGYGTYEFFDVRADARLWLAQPTNNFGWILISNDEQTVATACRFGAREDTLNAPSLTIQFTRRIAVPQVMQWELMTNAFRFRFVGEASVAYQVQRKTNLAMTNWTTFTNVAASPIARTNVITDAPQAVIQFYRIVGN